MLKLWKLTQDINGDYDTYDSCIVVAETDEEAKQIIPGGKYQSLAAWAAPEFVTARQIGIADSSLQSGQVVCASFNAG